MKRSSGVLLAVLLACVAPAWAQIESLAQNLDLPRVSPRATVTQAIGLSTVTIDYHRPGVKGRPIWNTNIVPYNGRPYPWRAGANENTTITFSHDATLDGHPIPAGTYGFHVIPTETEWTLIFSRNHTSWGSFFYRPEEDALRLVVSPREAPHAEWLVYGFEDLTEHSAEVYLHWEKKRVSFTVAFDVHGITIASIKDQLRSIPGFNWQGWYQAAQYCQQNNIEHDLALEWIDNSIQRQENDMNLGMKGRILAQVGKKEEARELLEKAMSMAPDGRKPALQQALDGL